MGFIRGTTWKGKHEKNTVNHLGLECEHSIVYLWINAACLILFASEHLQHSWR